MAAFLDTNRDIMLDVYEGVNLLRGIKPEILNLDGTPVTRFDIDLRQDPDCWQKITDYPEHAIHIDVFAESCTFTYDLGREVSADYVDVCGFLHYVYKTRDFAIAEFELYFGNDKATLYDAENRAFYHNNAGTFDPEDTRPRRNVDFAVNVKGNSGRFFGLKILKSNPEDDITRIACLGLYNDEITELYHRMETVVGESLAVRDSINVVDTKVLNGDVAKLTDGVPFNFNNLCTLAGNKEIKFIVTIPQLSDVDAVSLFAKNATDIKASYYLSDTSDNIFCEANKAKVISVDEKTLEEGLTCNLAKFEQVNQVKFIGIVINADKIELAEVGIHNYIRLVSVDTDKVLCDNFYGVGINAIPVALMPNSVKKGYNRAFWESEKKRLIQLKAPVVRVWFQIDWFLDNSDYDYATGKFNFDSDRMKEFYEYMDAFKEAGTEVEFNYGWKIPNEYAKWWGFADNKNQGSAPVDLMNFAKSCCAVLKELFRRGYDNVKYLTFFNEPQNGDDFLGPFADTAERGHYWRVMLDFVDWQLRREGLRDRLEIWGPEDGWDPKEIALTKEIDQGGTSPLDCITFHRYRIGYRAGQKLFQTLLDETCPTGKPLLMTEHGLDEYKTTWETNPVSAIMCATHMGLAGVLNWVVSDVDFCDPLDFRMVDSKNYWGIMNSETINQVYGTYYFMSLYARYLPAHSKVVATSNTHENLRSATYITPSGDIVVAVEAKDEAGQHSLKVDFGKEINRTFYKHEVTLPKHYHYLFSRDDSNAIIPPCTAEIKVGSVLEDSIGGEYTFAFYTTEKPATQVEMKPAYCEIKAGESITISPVVIDGEATEFNWSVAESVGEQGNISNSGIYTAPANAKAGDTVAIKAQLSGSDIYGITVIKIV